MGDSYTVVALTPLRKLIAARMTEANRVIPHFRLVADLEIDACKLSENPVGGSERRGVDQFTAS